MRMFEMTRTEDETGVSGRGKVVEGVLFSDGTCDTRWTPETSPGRSTNVWDSYGAFISVHVTPHPSNKTIITFSDGEVHDYSKQIEATVRKSRRKKKAVTPPMAVQGERSEAVGPSDPIGEPSKVPPSPK